MARKLIDQLFSPSEESKSARVLVSLQSWKMVISRLSRLEAQLKEHRKNTQKIENLIRQWLKEDRSRIANREQRLDGDTTFKANQLHHHRPFDKTREPPESLLALQFQLKKRQKERQSIKKALYENEEHINQILKLLKDSKPLIEDSLF